MFGWDRAVFFTGKTVGEIPTVPKFYKFSMKREFLQRGLTEGI